MADNVTALNHPSSSIVLRTPGLADIDPRRFELRNRMIERTIAIAVPVALFLLWEMAARYNLIDRRYFPAPSVILTAWYAMIVSGEFLGHLNASLSRIVQGYLIGASFGLVLGVFLGSIKIVRKGFEPILVGLNTIPKLSVLPLLLLMFGIGETTKILVVALGIVFIVLLNTMYAVATVSDAYKETARFYGANRFRVLLHVDLPAALPQIITGLRLAASIAIMVIVGAEFVAANEGLGFLVWNSWNLGLPNGMYIGITSMALLGVIAIWILDMIYNYFAPWQK